MSDSHNSGGIGFPAVLFIVFLILKLTKVITWSWWWVSAPLWIPAILAGVFIVLVAMFRAQRPGVTVW